MSSCSSSSRPPRTCISHRLSSSCVVSLHIHKRNCCVDGSMGRGRFGNGRASSAPLSLKAYRHNQFPLREIAPFSATTSCQAYSDYQLPKVTQLARGCSKVRGLGHTSLSPLLNHPWCGPDSFICWMLVDELSTALVRTFLPFCSVSRSKSTVTPRCGEAGFSASWCSDELLSSRKQIGREFSTMRAPITARTKRRRTGNGFRHQKSYRRVEAISITGDGETRSEF